jgi:hypothetical protein
MKKNTVQLFENKNGLWLPLSEPSPNLMLFEASSIIAQLLATGQRKYRISCMYFEFENVADPDDPVSVPTFDRSSNSGVTYYNNLASDPNRDYLRVPLISSLVTSSNPTDFPNGDTLTFFAQTSGSTGIHGKSFSYTANSKIFGAALACVLDEDDPTQDLVFARKYYTAESQKLISAVGQLGIKWQLNPGTWFDT